MKLFALFLMVASAATTFAQAVGGGGVPGASTAQVYPAAGIPNSTGTAWGTSYSATGSGTVVALATSPTLVTPALGVATATSVNLSAVPATLATQSANVSATTIFTTPAANHYYQLCGEEFITQAGTTSTMPFLEFNYTSPTDSVVKSVVVGIQGGASNAGTGLSNAGCVTVNVKASTAIQYLSTGYASSGTVMQYAVNATVTLIQ